MTSQAHYCGGSSRLPSSRQITKYDQSNNQSVIKWPNLCPQSVWLNDTARLTVCINTAHSYQNVTSTVKPTCWHITDNCFFRLIARPHKRCEMSRLFDEMFALPIRGTSQNPITPRTRLITTCFGNSSPFFSNLSDSFQRCLDEDRTEHRKTIALTHRFYVVYSIKYLGNLRTYALYRCIFGGHEVIFVHTCICTMQ